MTAPESPKSLAEERYTQATQELADYLGREPDANEVAKLRERLRDQALEEAVRRQGGRADWRADALNDPDPSAFGVNVSATLPAIWGAGERAFWSEGELAIIYGGDGTNKTTLAHNLLAGMLSFDGFGVVLSEPVRPLRPGERVLYLAFDRPRQIERSWSRFMRPEYSAEVAESVIWRTEGLPFDPVLHPLDVADWAAETYPGTYAVIFDNVWDAFGDFSDTGNATSAGIALNNLARSGIHPLALHHDRKAQGNAPKTPPETDDGMYGGRNFKGKAGSVVNLWTPPGTGGATLVVTQTKEPSEKIPRRSVFVDQATGRMLDYASSEVSLISVMKASPGERFDISTLASIHCSTVRPTKADKESTRRELGRLVKSGAVEYHEAAKRGASNHWSYAR